MGRCTENSRKLPGSRVIAPCDTAKSSRVGGLAGAALFDTQSETSDVGPGELAAEQPAHAANHIALTALARIALIPRAVVAPTFIAGFTNTLVFEIKSLASLAP
jgi:hypothetical protein